MFLQKNRDNLLELLCDNLFRVVVLKLLMFWDYINEALQNIFATLYLCMVEDGPFKVSRDNYQMMCEIKGLGVSVIFSYGWLSL